MCVCEAGSATAWTVEGSLADLEICLFRQDKRLHGSLRQEQHLVWLINHSVMSAVKWPVRWDFFSSVTSAFSLTGWQLCVKGFNHHSYHRKVAEYFPFVIVAASLSNKSVSRQHLLIAEVQLGAYVQCCTLSAQLNTFCVSHGWSMIGSFQVIKVDSSFFSGYCQWRNKQK